MATDIVTIPTAAEIEVLKNLGHTLVKSGFLPSSIKTPEQAIAIMLKGKELGIPPMQAFSSISIINGKPTVSSELMLALIFKKVSGAHVDFIETTDKRCIINASRPNSKEATFCFSMEDASRAGLEKKQSWATYPAAMLRARCISAMARAMFPDAIMGASYTAEELGADVDEDGEVIVETPTLMELSSGVKELDASAKSGVMLKPQISGKTVSKEDHEVFVKLYKEKGWSNTDARTLMETSFGKTSASQLFKHQLAELSKHIEANPKVAIGSVEDIEQAGNETPK